MQEHNFLKRKVWSICFASALNSILSSWTRLHASGNLQGEVTSASGYVEAIKFKKKNTRLNFKVLLVPSSWEPAAVYRYEAERQCSSQEVYKSVNVQVADSINTSLHDIMRIYNICICGCMNAHVCFPQVSSVNPYVEKLNNSEDLANLMWYFNTFFIYTFMYTVTWQRLTEDLPFCSTSASRLFVFTMPAPQQSLQTFYLI